MASPVDYIEDTDKIDDAFLSHYKLFIQLNFPPYAWTPTAMAAFERYIEEGRGGWIGFHHATLLGEFDGYPMWPWFSDFMGGIRFTKYIPTFVTGTVTVEGSEAPGDEEAASAISSLKMRSGTPTTSRRGRMCMCWQASMRVPTRPQATSRWATIRWSGPMST
jgi:hypothetical protein